MQKLDQPLSYQLRKKQEGGIAEDKDLLDLLVLQSSVRQPWRLPPL